MPCAPFQHSVPRGGTPRERTRHVLPNMKPNPLPPPPARPARPRLFQLPSQECLSGHTETGRPESTQSTVPSHAQLPALKPHPASRPAQKVTEGGSSVRERTWCARVVCRTSSRQEGEQADAQGSPSIHPPLMRNIGRKRTLYLTQRMCISRRATTHTQPRVLCPWVLAWPMPSRPPIVIGKKDESVWSGEVSSEKAKPKCLPVGLGRQKGSRRLTGSLRRDTLRTG